LCLQGEQFVYARMGKKKERKKGEREDCLDVQDEQFGCAGLERGRERERRQRKKGSEREAGRGERKKER
jgi:hypothetical protein